MQLLEAPSDGGLTSICNAAIAQIPPSRLLQPFAASALVAQEAVSLEHTAPWRAHLNLPARQRLVALRELEHRVGRELAAAALARLGSTLRIEGAQANGTPIWPPGFVGSIAHSRGVVAAVAANAADLPGIGIDVESIVDQEAASRVEAVCMLDEERTISKHLSSDAHCLYATALFSAKEALFKSLFPLDSNLVRFH